MWIKFWILDHFVIVKTFNIFYFKFNEKIHFKTFEIFQLSNPEQVYLNSIRAPVTITSLIK